MNYNHACEVVAEEVKEWERGAEEARKMFNETYFFEKLILLYLYKKKKISTTEIEEMFGGKNDTQNVNNIISNDTNTTSYIHKRYMKYDKKKQILSITEKGENLVRKWFNKKRKSKKN